MGIIRLEMLTKRNVLILICTLAFTSCEKVVEIETPTDSPRLVVNGILRVDENDQWIPIEIKVSLTNNFFEETPITSLEGIRIITQVFDEFGSAIGTGVSNLTEIEKGSGIYVPDPSFDTDQRIPTSVLLEDALFTLVIDHEGRRYAAQTRYVPSTPIDTIEQGIEPLFNDESKELIVTFTDNEQQDNFYILDFGFGEFSITEDQFYQGESYRLSYFYSKKLLPGDLVTVSLIGADQSFYNYMNVLLEQTEINFGVFETPVATARGNVFDITGLDNINIVDNVSRPMDFPLGYFAIVQSFSKTFTIE